MKLVSLLLVSFTCNSSVTFALPLTVERVQLEMERIFQEQYDLLYLVPFIDSSPFNFRDDLDNGRIRIVLKDGPIQSHDKEGNVIAVRDIVRVPGYKLSNESRKHYGIEHEEEQTRKTYYIINRNVSESELFRLLISVMWDHTRNLGSVLPETIEFGIRAFESAAQQLRDLERELTHLFEATASLPPSEQQRIRRYRRLKPGARLFSRFSPLSLRYARPAYSTPYPICHAIDLNSGYPAIVEALYSVNQRRNIYLSEYLSTRTRSGLSGEEFCTLDEETGEQALTVPIRYQGDNGEIHHLRVRASDLELLN